MPDIMWLSVRLLTGRGFTSRKPHCPLTRAHLTRSTKVFFPFFSFRCAGKPLLRRLATMKKTLANLLWFLVAVAGTCAYAILACHRGEQLNSVYILIAALCSYAIGYRSEERRVGK